MRLLLNHQRRPGQSLVEFAIFTSLLITILLAMVDFAMAYSTHLMIKNAVAEAGYYAAQNPGDEQGIRTQILTDLASLNPQISSGDISITTDCAGSNGAETHIEVSYSYPLLFGLVGARTIIPLSNETTVPQFGGC